MRTPKRRLLDRSDNRSVERRGLISLVSLLIWIGSGFAHGNWLLAAVIASLMLPAYGHRIASEVRLLRERLGGAYESYSRSTWQLVPFLF
jgi:protein-S-isoprenylcysteine O-methyltransferase Ste14